MTVVAHGVDHGVERVLNVVKGDGIASLFASNILSQTSTIKYTFVPFLFRKLILYLASEAITRSFGNIALP
jgi:hypothetical protein